MHFEGLLLWKLKLNLEKQSEILTPLVLPLSFPIKATVILLLFLGLFEFKLRKIQ